MKRSNVAFFNPVVVFSQDVVYLSPEYGLMMTILP